jgi:hypothetical protein
MVYMFCYRNKMIDILHVAMVQQSGLYAVSSYKSRPFVFGFNNVLMAN